ncbi:MAG: cupin domain-containing protein [Acidimicrobiia bacterium]
MGFRRVVVGQSEEGKAVIVSDEHVESLNLGRGSPVDLLWALEADPVVPNDGSIPELGQWFPEPGRMRVSTLIKMPAGQQLPAEPGGDRGSQLGLSATYETTDPGMHKSQTINVNMILSGEMWLELDDGAVKHLHPGDVVIQNGIRHRWSNRTDQPTTLFGVGIGARLIHPPLSDDVGTSD